MKKFLKFEDGKHCVPGEVVKAPGHAAGQLVRVEVLSNTYSGVHVKDLVTGERYTERHERLVREIHSV